MLLPLRLILLIGTSKKKISKMGIRFMNKNVVIVLPIPDVMTYISSLYIEPTHQFIIL